MFSNLRTLNDAFELRSSVPVNQAKKPDVDFLRSTTYTPKPRGAVYGQYEMREQQHQSYQTEAHDTKPSVDQPPHSFKFDKYVKKEEPEKDWKNDPGKIGR